MYTDVGVCACKGVGGIGEKSGVHDWYIDCKCTLTLSLPNIH